jgi:hypothetical protein
MLPNDPAAPQQEPLALDEEQLDHIARSYFADECDQQKVKDAISDAFSDAFKDAFAAGGQDELVAMGPLIDELNDVANYLSGKRKTATGVALGHAASRIRSVAKLLPHSARPAATISASVSADAKDELVTRVDDFGTAWKVTKEKAAEIDAAIAAQSKGQP